MTRVLIAPDSFKGSLTSVEVARALASGWARVRPADTLDLVPLADGGEGTLAAVEAAGAWTRRTTVVADPLGRRVAADWLVSDDGERAVIEMAQASGLSRLAVAELDPVGASSRGTGELVLAAIDAGARNIILGIGGSATTDGGRGLVEALGGVVPSGGSVRLAGLDPRLGRVAMRVACDVANPLLGPDGAAAIYGPQKGADAAQVQVLDDRNTAWADGLEAAVGRRDRDTPGAGAAGGVGFALLALGDRFASFALQPGVGLVMAATGFAERLAAADLVITGEGRIDAQTAFGKTAAGVARAARAAGVRCLAVGGGIEPAGAAALEALGATAVPVWPTPVPLEVAMAAGAAPIEACGERLARSVGTPAS